MAQRVPDRMLRPWWQSPPALGGGGLALVAVIVVVVLLVGGGGVQAVTNPTPVPASVLNAVTHPSASIFSAVDKGGQPGQLSRLTGSKPITDSAGKPEVVYVGAEYCPYCAAERWSLIMALSRFGTFSNLKEMSSSSSDTDPSTSTFTFVDASYSSQYLAFSTTEVEDRDGNALQTPSSQVQQIYTTYNQPPYTVSTGYPFLDIAGQSVLYDTSYDPAILQGLSWQQIASDLSNPQSGVTRAIVGNANWLTAAICVATGNQPGSVCSTSTIQGIETSLKAQSTVGS